MIYGYVRVSTATQNPDRQIRKMLDLGIPPQRVYVDHASGKDLDRPRYRELMEAVRSGDLVVIDSLDRLGRDYYDVTEEWRRLVSSGVDIQCLDLDFLNSRQLRELGSIGVCVEDMLLSLLAYVAQTEREKNRQRQKEGIEAARARGQRLGRRKSEYPPSLLAEAREKLEEEGASAAARVLGCHRNTVYRMVSDGRL